MQSDAFVLQAYRVKRDQDLPEMAQNLMRIVRSIEKNSVAKLNCMFIAARRLAQLNVDTLLRDESTIDIAKDMNQCINEYFKGEDLEEI